MSILSTEEWNQFCNIMNGYIFSQTLATACDFDLFTYLSLKNGATLEDIQEALGLTEYSAKVLLLSCCAVGLTKKQEETKKYFNSSVAEKVLVTTSAYSMVPFVQFNYQIQQRCSTHLTKALKENRNAGLDEFPGSGDTLYKRLTNYPELEKLFQNAMGAYTRLSPKMIELQEFSSVKHLLDIGGGDGSIAIGLCQKYPLLKVTIFETPTVSSNTRKIIEKENLSERITCYEGDIFHSPWPTDCDGVLMSHLVEIFSPDKVKFLYSKAFQSLPPMGQLFIWTIMANDSETGGLQAAKSSMYFLSTASGEGMAYPGNLHESWLEEVGFGLVKRFDASEINHGAVIATKS